MAFRRLLIFMIFVPPTRFLDSTLIRQLRVNTFTERVKRQMVKAFMISYADYKLYSNTAILNGHLNPRIFNHEFGVEKSGIQAWG
jgi:hypothetical protein